MQECQGASVSHRKGHRLSICIPSWNRADRLRECLQSVFMHVGSLNPEVFVVDNGSTDINVRMVREEFPLVRLIVNETNYGFAAACNQALRMVTGDYVLLLNSDVKLLDDGIGRLIRRMNDYPDCGAATCASLRSLSPAAFDAPFGHTFPAAGSLIVSEFLVMSGLARAFRRSAGIQRRVWVGKRPQEEQEVAHINGACMLVRRDAIGAVGLLDESFFMFFEETDWCYRMRQQGWTIRYLPVATIFHEGHASVNLRNDGEQLYLTSLRKYLRKHQGRRAELLFTAYSLTLRPALKTWYTMARWLGSQLRGTPATMLDERYAELR